MTCPSMPPGSYSLPARGCAAHRPGLRERRAASSPLRCNSSDAPPRTGDSCRCQSYIAELAPVPRENATSKTKWSSMFPLMFITVVH